MHLQAEDDLLGYSIHKTITDDLQCLELLTRFPSPWDFMPSNVSDLGDKQTQIGGRGSYKATYELDIAGRIQSWSRRDLRFEVLADPTHLHLHQHCLAEAT